MYMASYKGKQTRTFGVHETLEAAKQDAEQHAIENGKLRGQYIINEGELKLNNLFMSVFTGKTLRGSKHGKNIIWDNGGQ